VNAVLPLLCALDQESCHLAEAIFYPLIRLCIGGVSSSPLWSVFVGVGKRRRLGTRKFNIKGKGSDQLETVQLPRKDS